MRLKEEFLFDFSEKMPRILVSGNIAVIDSVKRTELVTGEQIITRSGGRHMAVSGVNLVIRELADERMMIEGRIDEIRFYNTSKDG